MILFNWQLLQIVRFKKIRVLKKENNIFLKKSRKNVGFCFHLDKYLEGISLHLALEVVSEHLTAAEPAENLLCAFLWDAPVAALLAFSEEGRAEAAAAMDDFRALLTRETRAGGITGDAEETAAAAPLELAPDPAELTAPVGLPWLVVATA